MNMRRVWVFALVIVLAVSAIIVGSATYLYLSDEEGMKDEPLESGKKLVSGETNDTSSQGEDKYPTERRYVNVYQPGESREWILESEFSMENHNASTYEITRYPNAKPTAQDVEAAWELYNRSYEAAEDRGWFQFENAMKHGYEQLSEGSVHYVNSQYYSDDEVLNPERPESLVYYDDPNNNQSKLFGGYMYLTEDISSEGEQFGGPITVWHYHPAGENAENVLREHFGNSDDFVNGNLKKNRSREMIHVWFIRNPEGPFATNMRIPSQYLNESEKIPQRKFETHIFKNMSK